MHIMIHTHINLFYPIAGNLILKAIKFLQNEQTYFNRCSLLHLMICNLCLYYATDEKIEIFKWKSQVEKSNNY